jgi:hypothetical protein
MSQESFDQRPTTPVDCMLLTMSKTAAAAEDGGLWPLSLREITELHASCRGAAGRMLRSYSTQERIPPPLSQLTDFASSIKSSSLSELYSVHARIRKSLGEMTRKLSDTASQ